MNYGSKIKSKIENARAPTRSPQGGAAAGGQESAAESAAKNHAESVVNPADLFAAGGGERVPTTKCVGKRVHPEPSRGSRPRSVSG